MGRGNLDNLLGGGVNLGERSRRIKIPILVENSSNHVCSIEDLLAHIQRGVRQVREENPDLARFHLHDVSLCMQGGTLLAEFLFRM
jgi:hypothetical protein